MDREGQRLQQRIKQLERRNRGRRIPADIRGEIVAYVRARRAAGEPWAAMGRRVGLSLWTLRRWTVARTPRLVPVRIRGAAEGTGGAISLVTPATGGTR